MERKAKKKPKRSLRPREAVQSVLGCMRTSNQRKKSLSGQHEMDCMAGVLAKHKSEKKGGQERTRQDQLRSNPAPALIESLNFSSSTALSLYAGSFSKFTQVELVGNLV